MQDQALPGALYMTFVHHLLFDNNAEQVELKDRENLRLCARIASALASSNTTILVTKKQRETVG